MPKVEVLNMEGKKVGNIELADSIFAIDVNESVDIDVFKKLDRTPLGKNVSLSVRRYSNEAFRNRKNNSLHCNRFRLSTN